VNPISRRRFLTATAASAGLLALRCAGGGEREAGEPTLGPVKTGGTFRLATTTPALSIDPHTEVTMGLAFVCFIYGYLLHEIQQESGAPSLVFDHAQSLEQPETLTYIFHMRPGVRFQDVPPANGREVTADDVLYSFQRIASGDSTRFWTSGIADMSVPDRATFSVRLVEPYAYTMAEFGGIRTAIVPPEAVQQWGDLKMHACGSGPFQVRSLSPNAGIEMERNPGYYVAGIPYIDAMSWRTFIDDAAMQAAFKAQQIDVYGPPSKLQADSVAGLSDHVILTKSPNLAIFMINLNEIKAPVLQDKRVREALDISLDRDAMIGKLCSGEGKYTGPVSWGLEYWSLPQEELRSRYRRDVGKARQLLEAAGASDLTLDLKCVAGGSSDLAAMIKEQAAEAGITINIKSMELGTWITDLFAQNFELMVAGGLPYGDENLPLQFNHTYNWTRKQNPVRLPEPAIDAELDEILRTVDPAARQKLVLDVTRKIIDRHGPFLYLYAPYAFTARWDYVRGYEDVNPAMIAYTYDMWLDK
jgi:peptide/nickel transport system substrate-binding protein/glutathione transport system substrate-binding protein